MKYNYRDVYLPQTAVDYIEKEFPISESRSSMTDRYNAIDYLSILYSRNADEQYTALASSYLLKRYGRWYTRFLNKLREDGVVEGYKTKTSNDSYYVADVKGEGRCKMVKVSAEYKTPLKGETLEGKTSDEMYKLIKKGFGKIEVRYTVRDKSASQKRQERLFYRNFRKLSLDFEKLKKEVTRYVETIKAKDFLITEEELLEGGYSYISSIDRKWRGSIEKAHRTAGSYGYDLYRDGDTIYSSSEKRFEEFKKKNILESYMSDIMALEQGKLYAKRNSTNKRLDTVFTNLPSNLLNIIKKDNDLVEIDLKNSQMAMYSHILVEEKGYENLLEDEKLFVDLSRKGEVYDYASQELGISRGEAKKGFFQILFNKAGINTVQKERLREIFPNIIKNIDNYKKACGYKKFSVSLQKKESEIFISKIYPLLDRSLDLVFTKHDSFIVRREDQERAIDIIEGLFKKISFQGKLSIE